MTDTGWEHVPQHEHGAQLQPRGQRSLEDPQLFAGKWQSCPQKHGSMTTRVQRFGSTLLNLIQRGWKYFSLLYIQFAAGQGKECSEVSSCSRPPVGQEPGAGRMCRSWQHGEATAAPPRRWKFNLCAKGETAANLRATRNSTASREGLTARTRAVTRSTSQPVALPRPNATRLASPGS